ncbi:MAG: esterase family protein [Clostridia bacterium]|nr:esterase family protein [Clostridia bacterium]
MAVLRMNFLSKALGMQTNLTVILPTSSFSDAYNGVEEAYVPGMKYQTLYLLHGGSGDDSDFIHFTNIVRYADENKVAVVMPCAYNSCYTDTEDAARYFTYIAQELPRVCAALFPFSTRREDTFVAGLSMGSHGAMKLAINYPERFAAALMMSGAATRPGVPTMVPTRDGVFDFDAPPIRVPLGRIARQLEDPAFIRGTVNDVYAIARENVEKGRPLPLMLFRVGDCDHALYRAQRAEADLRAWGYETRIEVVKGKGHEWDLWDDSLRLALASWLPLRRSVIFPESSPPGQEGMKGS